MKPIVKFLPLLVLYIILVFLFSVNDAPHADEVRYYMFAENLAKGFYTESSNPNLMNGPGFPFYLAPFVKLGLPIIAPKLGNTIFIFFCVIFLYKSLLFYVKERTATVLAYCFGLYFPMLAWMCTNFSESLSLFMLCGFMYFTIKMLRSDKFRITDAILPGFMLGYLILIKVLFGHIVLATLVCAIIYYLLFRTSKAKKSILILSFGFLASTPFLIYTYSLTGRILYWGSNGGEQLYWMSTHYDKEWGSWIESTLVLNREIPDMNPEHTAFYDSVYTKPWVEINDLFMEKAVENIKKNPAGYVYNVIANTIRLIADGPRSYLNQSIRPYLYLGVNLLLLVPLIFSIYPAWKNRRSIPMEIVGLALFTLIYFGASMLLCAINRYFLLVVPAMFIWLGFVYSYFIQFSFDNKLKNLPS